MNFHETICGRRFFDTQLPHLIKALERIADGLTRPKMSLPHGMTIEPNFLHDLYYGEYEPSVFKEQDKKQQVLNHAVSAAETALRGELSKTPAALAAFEVYQTAAGERNSTVIEQAFESGYRTAMQMLLLGWYLLRRRTTPMDEQQHNAIELPKGLYEPVLRQPMELDFLLGQELSLCFHDLDGSHVFKTCYGDICKAVNALRDYARLLEMTCEQWDLTGFHRALYEYHAEKMREIAGKFQAGIGYDYDAAMEKCRRKKKRKKKEDDFGEDALVLAFKRTKQPAEQMKETDTDVDDSPWEEDEDEQESDD